METFLGAVRAVAVRKRRRVALIVVLAISVAVVTSAVRFTKASGRVRTTVHVVTPFRADATTIPTLHLQRVAGPCRPDSEVRRSISVMKTYTCWLPAQADSLTSAYVCTTTCYTDPCWPVSMSEPATMICLQTPELSLGYRGFQGLRVQVTNNPPPALGGTRPLASQPWQYQLSNGEICSALYPNTSFSRRHPPILGYICDQGNSVLYPAGPIDRSKQVWTIEAATTVEDANAKKYTVRAKITAAWFIGNGPT